MNTIMGRRRTAGFSAICAVALIAAGSGAQAAAPGEKEQSTGEKAKGAVTQPLSDVNLQKREIPPQLEAVLDDPYGLGGLKTCRQLSAAVEEMNAVLGPDVDIAVVSNRGKKRRDTVIEIAGNVMSGLLLPVRGVVREVTGSAENERRYRAAIYSGSVRRAFLKGIGKQKGCKPPAAPAAQPSTPS